MVFKKNVLTKYTPRLIVLLVLAAACNVMPAYAASSAPAGMFSALGVAFKWVRSILLVAAAASVVSYAFSFFLTPGGRDGEKVIAAARKKLLATCIACAALSLIPSFMLMGKGMVKDIAWKSGSGGSPTGNHIITPANTSGSSYADVTGGSGGTNPDPPVDPSHTP